MAEVRSAVPAPREGTMPPPAIPAVSPRLLLGAGVLIAIALLPWVSGLMGALILAVCVAPVHRRLAMHAHPRWSAGLLTGATALVLLVPGTWLLATTLREGMDALAALQRSDLLARLSHTRVGGLDPARQIESATAALLGWLSGEALLLFGSATKATLNLVIALFGLYYLLLDGPALGRRAVALLGVQPALATLLRQRFVRVTDALLVGTLLTAVVQGVLVGGGFALVGLPSAVLWGVVTACVSVLPVFGSALVWLPAVFVLASTHRMGAAILLLVIGAVFASNIDNVVRLVAYRRISGVHPMLTLVGAFAGVAVFGLAGVLIGPLVLTYFFELLRLHEASITLTRTG